MINLKSHQLEAVKDLHAKNGVGWVKGKVGSGKTFIALQFLKEKDVLDCVVFCPKSLVAQWQEEIKAFGYDGIIGVENYEKLLKDVFLKGLLNRMPEAIIADEMTKVKSGTGKIAKRFRKLQSKYRIGLAANLTPNNLSEVYSPVKWFNPNSLEDSFWAFKNAHCIFNPHIQSMIVGYRDPDKLIKMLNNFTVNVNWDGKDELPEATREIKYIEMGEDEKKRYKTLEKESILELNNGGTLTIPNMVSKLTRLVQLVNDPQLFSFDSGAKEKVLAELIENTKGKIIIFSEHAEVLKRFHKIYGGQLFIGSMTSGQRQWALNKFKKTDRLLFASSAGARGLNLQHAETIINYGLCFTNDGLDQRFGRIYRLQQTKPVKEIILIVKESCDERIWQIISRKQKLEEKFTRENYKQMLGV